MVDAHLDHKDPIYTNPFLVTLFLFELIVFIFFATAAEYSDATSSDVSEVEKYYSMYQDVHVMIFIGFGFLMTFLRKHGFNSLGMTFLLGVLSIQMGIMFNHVVHNVFEGHEIHVTLEVPELIKGDFAAGAVLISMGAVLGRVTYTQMLWMVFFELIFYAINEYIGVMHYEAVDMGGSMFVHTFGAYFGLGFSYMIGVPEEEDTEDEASVYHSDMFAMVGTIFLWMYWPSFNGALAGEYFHQQERVVINTVLSLCSSCISAFFFSHFYCGKLDMVHIQNASLAGGVAIGSSSDLVVGPWASILIGLLAGAISVTGYVKLTPRLNKYIYDVCGVHNLHGMPGVMGGIAGCISAASAGDEEYGENITAIFSARDSRSASEQGMYQAAALVTSIAMAFFGGAITGLIVQNVQFCNTRKRHLFSDEDEWEVPEQEFVFSYFGEKSKIREMEVVKIDAEKHVQGVIEV